MIAKYSYDMKPLYDVHLVFHMRWWEWYSYSFKEALQIPHEYRLQYSSVILGILALVGINAIFLYVPGAEYTNFWIIPSVATVLHHIFCTGAALIIQPMECSTN
ncbi:MAG: hypothetical protein ACLTDF_02935 [Coprococcus sp.]